VAKHLLYRNNKIKFLKWTQLLILQKKIQQALPTDRASNYLLLIL